jgi:DNA polymerase III delta prime subunit
LNTGKTTTILCLARILLGENFKKAVLELNASSERGIDVVRNKIKMFAQQKVILPRGHHKIIILDEADSMTEHSKLSDVPWRFIVTPLVLHLHAIRANKLLSQYSQGVP